MQAKDGLHNKRFIAREREETKMDNKRKYQESYKESLTMKSFVAGKGSKQMGFVHVFNGVEETS